MCSSKQNELVSRIDELQAKITALRPYEGEMLIQLQKYYRLGLTWTSNAIEGSSYTESETKILLEDGITIGGNPCGIPLRLWDMPRPMTICLHCL